VARTITQRELRNNSGEIMRGLDRGEEYTITRNGVPVGVLRPYARRQFVGVEAVKDAFAGTPRIDWRQLRDDLDAIADPAPPVRG
jgi:prevent-host-death family protein